MREFLESKGWYLFSQCSCGGTMRQNFKSIRFPSYEVQIAPNKSTFIILRNNVSVGSGKDDKLEEKMVEYAIL